MRRAWRLRAGRDYERVRGTGKSWRHPLLVLYAAEGPGPLATTRVGITVSRRVGAAVVRNRTRRRLRDAVARNFAAIPSGWDLVLIVRPAAAQAEFQALAIAVGELLSRAGLLRPTVTDLRP